MLKRFLTLFLIVTISISSFELTSRTLWENNSISATKRTNIPLPVEEVCNAEDEKNSVHIGILDFIPAGISLIYANKSTGSKVLNPSISIVSISCKTTLIQPPDIGYW